MTQMIDVPSLAANAPATTTTTPAGRRRVVRRTRPSVAAWLPVVWLCFIIGLAVFADLLPLTRFDIPTDLAPRTPPGFRLSEPLGTDYLGRSLLARVAFGGRQSLVLGVVAVLVSACLGATIGIVAGYLKGRVDAVIGVLLDTMLAFPSLVLLLAIASIGKRDVWTLVFGLTLLGVPTFARLARSQTIAVADREFIAAARALGASRRRIMFVEILPNIVPSLFALAMLVMGGFIVAEGSLSFLGLGVRPPTPSWGGMINDGRKYLSTSPYLVAVPSLCLILTVVSFRSLGIRWSQRWIERSGVRS